MENVFDKITLISTNLHDPFFSNFERVEIIIPTNRTSAMRIFYFLKIQLYSAFHIFRLRKKVGLWIFYLGGEALLIPLLLSKVLNVKIYLLLGGSLEKEAEFRDEFFYKILNKYYRLSLKICHRIILYSPNLVNQWNLTEFNEKIIIFPRHHLDFSIFKKVNDYNKREQIIGYIGSFSQVKGAHNLIEAIKKIDRQNKNLKFLFIGTGELKEEIKRLSTNPQFEDKIILYEWVEHADIPQYLNMMKLLVIPSYSEGLPNIMLESMACGTPVLGTSVGSIPEIINDGENGYLMKDNLPETIAEKIKYVMNDRNVETVSNNAYNYVNKNFSLESAIEKFKNIRYEFTQ
jgi:glycosyltransferase involved in cell wall biosynthesis